MMPGCSRRPTKKKKKSKLQQTRVTEFFSTRCRSQSSIEGAKRLKIEDDSEKIAKTTVNNASLPSSVSPAHISVQVTPEVQIVASQISPRRRKFPGTEKCRSLSVKRRLQFSPISHQKQKQTDDELLRLFNDKSGKMTALLNGPRKTKLKTAVKTVADLQQRLAETNKVARKLREQQVLNKNDQVDQLVGQLSPVKKKPPEKSSSSTSEIAVPDKNYGMISRLIDQVKIGVQLPLPVQYQLLADMFRDLDHVVSFLSAYGKEIQFESVKENVRRNLRRDFDESHLGQIKYVYPESYEVEMVKEIDRFGQRAKHNKYLLVINPSFTNDLTNYLLSEPPINVDPKTPPRPAKSPPKAIHPLIRSPRKSPRKVAQTITNGVVPTAADLRPRLEGWRMNCRWQIFRHRLLELVATAHVDFLTSLDPPIKLNNDEKARLKRWHPDFQLDKLPTIPMADLPILPKNSEGHTGKMEMLAFLAKKPPVVPEKTCPPVGVDGKNWFAIRLEKVRLKEKQKRTAELLANPEQDKLKARLATLKETMLRIMSSYYSVSKRGSLSLDDVANMLQRSYGIISKSDVEEHLQLLAEIAPDFVSIVDTFSRGKFLHFRPSNSPAIELIITDKLNAIQ